MSDMTEVMPVTAIGIVPRPAGASTTPDESAGVAREQLLSYRLPGWWPPPDDLPSALPVTAGVHPRSRRSVRCTDSAAVPSGQVDVALARKAAARMFDDMRLPKLTRAMASTEPRRT